MNARRKPRIFADHKPPLVAFVLVAVTSMVLLLHVARSDAAPAWLRNGVSDVVAGGLPLGQRVVTSTLLEPDPPVAAPEPTLAVAPSSAAPTSAAPSGTPSAPPSGAVFRHR